MKTRKILAITVVVLIFATLAFIWGNSLESVGESSEISAHMMGIVTPFLELFIGKDNVTDHIVRKIGHFVEFGTLGSELALLCVLQHRMRFQPVVNCLFAGLTTAVTDEALQLISARGSQVKDVLLDFCGVVTGIVIVILLNWLVRAIRSTLIRPNEQQSRI